MKVIGWFLLSCLVLTTLRWAVALALTAILLGIGFALIRAPIQTLSVVLGWLMLCAFAQYPALGLVLFILIIVAGGAANKE